MRAFVSSIFLTAWLFGMQEPAPLLQDETMANSPRAADMSAEAHNTSGRLDAAAMLASLPWWDPAIAADCTTLFSLVSDALTRRPVAPEDEVQQNRSRFAGLIKMGRLEGYDDARQTMSFKRSDQQTQPDRDPGPLEDEATASAARNALATVYAKLQLKFKLTCASGNVSISALPDDLVQAAAVLDHVLALDGVRTVKAEMPSHLRRQ